MTPNEQSQALMLQLNQIRKDKGLGQNDLADATRRSQSQVSSWLMGRSSPILFNAIALAAACGKKLVLIDDPGYQYRDEGGISER